MGREFLTMRPGQIVLRDLSTWYHGVRNPQRQRVMRTLVAREETQGAMPGMPFRDCPQTLAGCIIAAQCGL